VACTAEFLVTGWAVIAFRGLLDYPRLLEALARGEPIDRAVAWVSVGAVLALVIARLRDPGSFPVPAPWVPNAKLVAQEKGRNPAASDSALWIM
jgi:hypothetical protein